MPRLQVDCEGAFTFAASLVNISGSVVEDLKHWDESIAVTIGAADVTFRSSYAVNSQTDSASVFGDHSTLLQCVVYAFDAVSAHCKQETTGHLRLGSA